MNAANSVTRSTNNSVIEHADALDWLVAQEPAAARKRYERALRRPS